MVVKNFTRFLQYYPFFEPLCFELQLSPCFCLGTFRNLKPFVTIEKKNLLRNKQCGGSFFTQSTVINLKFTKGQIWDRSLTPASMDFRRQRQHFFRRNLFVIPPVILLARLFSHVQEIASRRLPFPFGFPSFIFILFVVDETKVKMGQIYCKSFGK